MLIAAGQAVISSRDAKSVETKNRSDDDAVPSNAVDKAYLGVGIAPVPEAVRSQFANILNDDRGVLVAEVAADSPAAKAGLKAHDILLTYDDQELFAPEQVAKLVGRDRVERTVKLQYVREGKKAELNAVLGKRPAIAATKPSPSQPQRQFPQTPEDRAERWRSFDSLSLTRLDKDRYKAEVKFRHDMGKLESYTYEGTHDEIHKAIMAEKHLPRNERRHLLRALDLPTHPFEFPGFRFLPDGSFDRDF